MQTKKKYEYNNIITLYYINISIILMVIAMNFKIRKYEFK